MSMWHKAFVVNWSFNHVQFIKFKYVEISCSMEEQSFLETGSNTRKCSNFIKKWGRYYKMGRHYYKAKQHGVIMKYGKSY